MQRETLEGVRVLDIATVIAGPWGAGILADFGAEVIKVEMPGRGDAFRAMGPLKDGVSTRWPCMGRNKKSVTLDFHYDEGKKLFLELVKKSDVLIENFRTGTLDKWGIGMDVLRDWDGIKSLDMPIYAKGVTPQGPWKFGPGEVNVPISCGGQVVFPGDILVGDMDGIVVIRAQDAEAVAEVAQKKKAGEDKTFALMESDLATYSEKHLQTTAKRFEGREPAFVEDASYTEMYKL